MKLILNEEARELFVQAVGLKIKTIREQKNMSQIDLAVKCNAEARKIGGTERGEYDFRITSLLVIANGLGVSITDLIDFELADQLTLKIWK